MNMKRKIRKYQGGGKFKYLSPNAQEITKQDNAYYQFNPIFDIPTQRQYIDQSPAPLSKVDQYRKELDEKQSRRENIGNIMTDVGTGLAVMGTQFRKPTQEEIEKGRGSWRDKSEILMNSAAWELADIMTGEAASKAIPYVGKTVKGLSSKYSAKLNNAYKHNPWAFSPNPEAYYRGIGREGVDDILQSGIVRSKKQKAYPDPYFIKGRIPGQYTDGYMAELLNEEMKGVGSFPKGSPIQTPVKQITLDNPNLKLYKEHWLKRYKEIPIKEKGGSVMAKSKIYIKPSKRGSFTAAAKKRGKSVQGFASQVMANKGNYSPAMVKKANFARNAKKWRKEYGGSLDELYDMYSFGGWLKDNAGSILQTAAGVGAMFIPGGQVAGMGMMASGMGNMIGSAGQQDEISEAYKPPLSKARQTYDIPMANGGNLKALSQRTDYKGASHERGGIKLPGMGVEVEGEESRTGDMVHSDKIKIDKNIYNAYKDMVPLKKSDIGKSVAQVLKRKDKRFERRSGDLWNDQARIASQKPFEMMSDELSNIYNQDNAMMPYGGELPVNMDSPVEIPEVAVYGKKPTPGASSFIDEVPAFTHLAKRYGQVNLKSEKGYNENAIRPKRQYIEAKTNKGALENYSIDEMSSMYPNIDFKALPNLRRGGYLKALNGMNLKKFISEPGNAPIIGSGINALTNILRRPEKVSYGQAKFTPTQFTPMDVSGGINRIRRSYGDARARMKRLNPRGYMNTLASMGASEAETIGDYSAGVGNVNAQMRNRAYSQDAESRNRISGMNTEIAMREAEANAANRGMRRTAIDASMNNMFTQIGQSARDKKLYKQQDKYINMMRENLKGWREMAYPSAKQDPYALLPWNDSMPGNYPIDETQIMPIADIDYIEPSYLRPFQRYGGRIRKLNTMRYRLNK